MNKSGEVDRPRALRMYFFSSLCAPYSSVLQKNAVWVMPTWLHKMISLAWFSQSESHCKKFLRHTACLLIIHILLLMCNQGKWETYLKKCCSVLLDLVLGVFYLILMFLDFWFRDLCFTWSRNLFIFLYLLRMCSRFRSQKSIVSCLTHVTHWEGWQRTRCKILFQ